MTVIPNLIQMLIDFIINAMSSITSLLTGWVLIPGELLLIADYFGPAGEGLAIVGTLAIAVIAVKLIPGL